MLTWVELFTATVSQGMHSTPLIAKRSPFNTRFLDSIEKQARTESAFMNASTPLEGEHPRANAKYYPSGENKRSTKLLTRIFHPNASNEHIQNARGVKRALTISVLHVHRNKRLSHTRDGLKRERD